MSTNENYAKALLESAFNYFSQNNHGVVLSEDELIAKAASFERGDSRHLMDDLHHVVLQARKAGDLKTCYAVVNESGEVLDKGSSLEELSGKYTKDGQAPRLTGSHVKTPAQFQEQFDADGVQTILVENALEVSAP